jgi:serine/threonine protein kinase
MVLDYAKGGNFNYWSNNNYNNFDWSYKLTSLWNIIKGLKEIHQNQMFHRDFHTGNILLDVIYVNSINDNSIYISDMGLCGEVGNTDKTSIYGVMPYVAPEVLRGKPYTQAADIYSFGMIMYFVATGRQPFADCAHEELLALRICNGIRPEINEQEIPKCYINLMKKCWDSNPDNRPNTDELSSILSPDNDDDEDWYKQIEEAEKYFSVLKKCTIHPQAIYTSRLLNPYTECLTITEGHAIDFTK